MANFDVTISKPKTATGGLTFAPKGTTLPTDAKTPLDVKFKPFGYISEDGVTLSSDSSDEDIIVWGGYKVRKVRSQYSESVSFRVLSTRDVDVLKACFGDKQVTGSGTQITVKHTADVPSKKVYTIETRDEDGFARRYVIPDGQLMVSGDRNLSHASADGFDVSIESFPDADGVCIYEYTELPAAVAA